MNRAAHGRPKQEETGPDDRVWRALSDRSRRQILDLLRQRPMTTSELEGHFPFTRFAVMKHLRVLEEAKLITVERRGRERFNHLNPVPVVAILRRWIRPFELVQADRLLRLKAAVEDREEDR
jgi:DNA-binding transcriptional ArsR family regulator